MLSFILLISCQTSPIGYSDYSTATSNDANDTGVEDTSLPPDDTGEDPEEPVNTNRVSLQTFDVDCSRLALHTLTLTRLIPGELNPSPTSDPKNDLTASFLEEKNRYALYDGDIELTPIIEEGQAPYEVPKHCLFEIELVDPEEWELNSLNGDESNSDLKWAFYYPALFIGETVICDDDNQSCTLSETIGTSQEPPFGTINPQLAEGDFYNWAGDTFLVYITGEIIGSFADMGFRQGWNLAKFEGNEMKSVQAISQSGNLMPIGIEIGDLLPRYSMTLGGMKPGVDNTLTEGYSIGARPLPWLPGVEMSSSDVGASPIRMRFQITPYSPGADQYYQMSVWGEPDTNHFFNSSYDTNHDMYLQWADFIDVAPEIPVVFDGNPTQINGQTTILGDEITVSNSVLGSLCIESDRLAFVYYDTADRPSETLWYQLANAANLTTNIHPGWHAVYGTQGEPSTWRFVLENQSSSGFNYTDTTIGADCTAFPEWGN